MSDNLTLECKLLTEKIFSEVNKIIKNNITIEHGKEEYYDMISRFYLDLYNIVIINITNKPEYMPTEEMLKCLRK